MKAWPWIVTTAILATVMVLYLTGALDGLDPIFSESERLKKELQEERQRADSIQYTNQVEIARLEAVNDSLIALDSINETQKHDNTQQAEDAVRYLRDAPLDSVGTVLTRAAPSGY